jgi:hypothetical protein
LALVNSQPNFFLAELSIIYSGWGMIPDGDAQIMIDNHDNQRGHGSMNSLFFLDIYIV